jgi:transcriptional regulator with XRE-family HTH domain
VKHAQTYQKFIERVTSSVDYKVDVAALEFVDELVRCMRQTGVTQAELARRLGASEPYVSKVLRGDANFTLATMVKLATAVGQGLRVILEPAKVVPNRRQPSQPASPPNAQHERALHAVREPVAEYQPSRILQKGTAETLPPGADRRKSKGRA